MRFLDFESSPSIQTGSGPHSLIAEGRFRGNPLDTELRILGAQVSVLHRAELVELGCASG